MNEIAWQKIQDEKDNLQPTPPVGEPIVWYPEGDVTRKVAGQCNGVEGPGRIVVVVSPRNSFQQHRTACYHISNPIHKKPNIATKNNGAWDYPRGKVPKEDYELHKKDLEKRTEGLLAAEDKAKKETEDFQRRKAEREDAMRGKLKEVLPTPF